MPESIIVFTSYADEDQPLLLKLSAHLAPLRQEGLITLWADRDINPGADREKEIHSHLNTAQIILLLISPDFINSDYCYNVKMKRALERYKARDACVIPILCTTC